MKPNLIDPNNHPPAVTAGDGWDDVEGFEDQMVSHLSVLPPKRVQHEQSQLADAVPLQIEQAGLRIDSPVVRRAENSEPSELDVQEISGEVVKLLQPEPSPEKVLSHKVFHERPAADANSDFPNHRNNEWESTKSTPLLWLLGTGVTITILLASALAILPKINRANALRAGASTPALVPEKQEESQSSTDIGQMLNRQEEAKQIFEIYAKAERFAEILPLVLDSARNESLISDHFQPIAARQSWKVSDDALWRTTNIGSKVSGQLRGSLPDFSVFTAYFTVENKQLKLDWKATTAFSTATFEELVKGKGNPLEIRGILAPTNFFTQFWTEGEYQSYRLVSPEGEDAIWCYAKNDSEIAQKIREQFTIDSESQGAPKEIRITLRLEAGPNDVLTNQWLIAELIQIDWNQP